MRLDNRAPNCGRTEGEERRRSSGIKEKSELKETKDIDVLEWTRRQATSVGLWWRGVRGLKVSTDGDDDGDDSYPSNATLPRVIGLSISDSLVSAFDEEGPGRCDDADDGI
ncbi:hypothetical protein TWF594_004182 [Orbilia oligospora]|nr:hypothetical protein TWF594_004182 [Orbilia oligospora]